MATRTMVCLVTATALVAILPPGAWTRGCGSGLRHNVSDRCLPGMVRAEHPGARGYLRGGFHPVGAVVLLSAQAEPGDRRATRRGLPRPRARRSPLCWRGTFEGDRRSHARCSRRAGVGPRPQNLAARENRRIADGTMVQAAPFLGGRVCSHR